MYWIYRGPIAAYLGSCPTCTKNLEWYLPEHPQQMTESVTIQLHTAATAQWSVALALIVFAVTIACLIAFPLIPILFQQSLNSRFFFSKATSTSKKVGFLSLACFGISIKQLGLHYATVQHRWSWVMHTELRFYKISSGAHLQIS